MIIRTRERKRDEPLKGERCAVGEGGRTDGIGTLAEVLLIIYINGKISITYAYRKGNDNICLKERY